MTVIWAEVTPQGIIIGGDKHRTHRKGSVIAGYSVVTKVFKTPNKKIIVGAAGLGRFGGKDKSEWLKEKIVPLHDQPIATIAQNVHAEIVRTYDAEFRTGTPQGFIVDIAGYRKDGETWVPAVYYISNFWSIENGNLSDIRHDFGQCPEIITIERFQGLDAATVVQRVFEKTNAGDPVWIYHTPLVGQFRPEAERRLKDWLSKHGTPRTLAMWERQVKETIVAWSAYVKAPRRASGGGGVDVVSVAPPKLNWFVLAKRIVQSMIASWFKGTPHWRRFGVTRRPEREARQMLTRSVAYGRFPHVIEITPPTHTLPPRTVSVASRNIIQGLTSPFSFGCNYSVD